MLKKIIEKIKRNRSSYPFWFLSKKEKTRIIAAIREAELKTSGEIRVHLQRNIKGDSLREAKNVFDRLGMARTLHHSGVLILIAAKDRRFAILADRGIHEKLDPAFLEHAAKKMEKAFRDNRFADGIVDAVAEFGEHLKVHFPHTRKDINELPDEISYSL